MLGSLSAFGAVPSKAVRWRHEHDPHNASDPGPSLRVTRPARNGDGRIAGRPPLATHHAPDNRKLPTFAPTGRALGRDRLFQAEQVTVSAAHTKKQTCRQQL